MKHRLSTSIIIVAFFVLILAGCAAPAPVETPDTAASPSPASQVPTKPAPSATPSPTPTMTPTPVSIAEAAARRVLTELETYGKGHIQASGFSPDGSFFAAATQRGLYVFKPHSWEEITYVPATPGENIEFLRFSRDSTLAAGGDSNGNITFWDTKTWEVHRVIAAGKGPITSLDIAPDNKTCITISDEKEVALWNMESGEQIKSMTRAKDTWSVNYSRDGSWIMLSEPGGQGDVTTWTSADLTFLNRLHQLGRRAPDQAVSPFSDVVASYSQRTLTIHDFDQDRDYVFKDIFGWTDKIQMVFVNDVTLFVKSNYADSYRLFDLRTGSMREESMAELPKLKSKNPDLLYISKAEEIKSLGFDSYPNIVAVSPQGDRLILGEGIYHLSKKSLSNPNLVNDSSLWANAAILDDGYVWVVDSSQPRFPNKVKKGNLIITILDFLDMTMVDQVYFSYDLPDGIEDTALSPDGSILAAGLYDGSVYFWITKTGEQIADIRAHSKVYEVFGLYSAFRDFSFNHDGSHFLTVGADGLIKVWALQEKTPVLTTGGKLAVFSPDGKQLVYLDSLNRIQILSLDEKEPQVTLEGQPGEIATLAFSPDGALLVSGGKGSMKVWSMGDQKLLMDVPILGDILSLAFSPDGTRLYTRTRHGVISVWGCGAP